VSVVLALTNFPAVTMLISDYLRSFQHISTRYFPVFRNEPPKIQ
jgi:hypothetical protein